MQLKIQLDILKHTVTITKHFDEVLYYIKIQFHESYYIIYHILLNI